MNTNNNKLSSWKSLAIATAALLSVSTAQALPSYEFSHTPAAGKIMNDYTTTWNPNTETLGISSSWDVAAGIDRIAFLITDGGSPWLTTNEQFLWYDLDLNTDTLSVQNYFHSGPRTTIQSFDVSADVTANSIDLSIDHTFLNSLTAADFPGYSGYNGAGFSNDIGIWYYMYNGNSLVETLDIHHGTPTQVPEPNTFWLILMGFLVVAGFRQIKNKAEGIINPAIA